MGGHDDAVTARLGGACEDLRGQLGQHHRERRALPVRLRGVAAGVGAAGGVPGAATFPVAVVEQLGEADVGTVVVEGILRRVRRRVVADETAALREEGVGLGALTGQARLRGDARTEAGEDRPHPGRDGDGGSEASSRRRDAHAGFGLTVGGGGMNPASVGTRGNRAVSVRRTASELGCGEGGSMGQALSCPGQYVCAYLCGRRQPQT